MTMVIPGFPPPWYENRYQSVSRSLWEISSLFPKIAKRNRKCMLMSVPACSKCILSYTYIAAGGGEVMNSNPVSKVFVFLLTTTSPAESA